LVVAAGAVYYGGVTNVRNPRCHICAIDAATGTQTVAAPDADDTVTTLAAADGVVYAAGAFTHLGGVSHPHLGAFRTSDGSVTAWAPGPASQVNTLAAAGGVVYVGGDFEVFAGRSRRHVAAIDAAGTLTSWNPSVGVYVSSRSGTVDTIAVAGGTVYVGGRFTLAHVQPRAHLAAISPSGDLAAFSADTDAQAYALAVAGGAVYAAGTFTTVRDQIRNGVAALDATSGAVTAWNPNVTSQQQAAQGEVDAVAIGAGRVYLGGSFTTVNLAARNRLAAVDTATGALITGFDPGVTGSGTIRVQGMALQANTLCIAGAFTTVGSQARKNLASVDATTGAVTAFNPNADGSVSVVLSAGGAIYVAGGFANVGGQARARLAALDPTTGAATAWNPAHGADVYALASGGGTLYVGGLFTTIAGLLRAYGAAFDLSNGALAAWNPAADNSIFALATAPGAVAVGGTFTLTNDQLSSSFARLSP
jgi:outer membrane protein assembly factor BamB